MRTFGSLEGFFYVHVSVPSLHRESADSLIVRTDKMLVSWLPNRYDSAYCRCLPGVTGGS